MAEEKQATKAAILYELESIKGLLVETGGDEGNNSASYDEVPTLQDIVSEHKPYAPLPGQQNLFNESGSEPSSEPNSSSKESITQKPEPALPADENPFLPKHIRDRLQGNKPHLGMQSFIPPELSAKTSKQQMQTRALVDELVTEYLPKIEAELRQRLHKLIQTPDAD